MKKFSNVNPANIQDDPRIIFVFEYFNVDKSDSDYLYVLSDEDYLLFAKKILYVYRYDDGTEKTRKWVGGTKLEIPKAALPWFVKVIEEKFFRTEDQGGLPKGKFGCEEVISGEKLIVSRMFGEPGYSFRNHSRHSYLFEDSTDPQDLPLSDELLFKKGLFEELKKIAIKIENGDL